MHISRLVPKVLLSVFIFFFLSIIFFFRLPTKVVAADGRSAGDLWVDGFSGSDAGECTDQLNPCASIKYAADQTIPGDTVNVKSGPHIGNDILITHGSTDPANPIFYRAWPGTGKVRLPQGSFRISNSDYIGVSGFEISGESFGVYISGSSNHILLENLLIHDVDTPIILTDQVATVFILNNTLYADNTSGSAGIALVLDVIPTSSITIENNIIANAETGVLVAPGSLTPGPFHDYNSFWQNDTNYSAGVSAGANDVTADPLFINTGLGIFRTSSSSPVIDAGVNPSAGGGPPVAVDINGIARPIGGFYDIGAYEYVYSFTVNSTADATDLIPDGICDVDGLGQCTLRAAIQEADELHGNVTIIVPAGTYTLTIPPGDPDDNILTGDLDIDASYITISGAGASSTFIDGGGLDSVFWIVTANGVTISGVTVQNGQAIPGKSGGGITVYSGDLSLDRVAVVNNAVTDAYGGGIIVGGGGSATATVTNSTIITNTAGSNADGGGIYVASGGAMDLSDSSVQNNNACGGAGIGLQENSSATVKDVTISGNNASCSAGGGILNYGNLALTNTTVANNSVLDNGGGIFDFGVLDLLNDTISGNTAGTSGGIGLEYQLLYGTSITATNTILSSNTVQNCESTLTGNLISLGYNLSSDGSCSTVFNVTGDLNSTDPKLSTLADNGGDVETVALLAGSPAIDTGTNTGCPATDARGTTRPQNGTCDIGAYEYVYSVTSSPASSQSGGSPGASSCSSTPPSGVPNLYKVEGTGGTAKLFFTDVPGSTAYQVFYGYKPGDMRFATTIAKGTAYVVRSLNPFTKYYFAVRGENVCAGGTLSNWRSVTTGGGRGRNTVNNALTTGQTPSPTLTPSPTVFESNVQPTTTTSPNLFGQIIGFFKNLLHL